MTSTAEQPEEDAVQQSRPHDAAGARDAVARVPAQQRAADSGSATRGRDAGRPAGPGSPGAARGEHTHSETPVPLIAPRQADLEPRWRPPEQPPKALVQRSSVRGQILDALRTALATGELKPGEVHSAPVLGERFGVSATPVREAMQQLALEGAVEVVPNRGFRVVERGTRELAELAEVRALLEVPVMLRLAGTVAPDRWAQLFPLAEETVRIASTGCPAAYAECDRAFHRALLSLAGNEQLVRIAEDLHRRSQLPLVGGPVRQRRADLVADAAEHGALLEALIAGDLDVVRELVVEHFATGTD